MKPNVLILGIGNYDRQDDGVAWHILQSIKRKLDRPTDSQPYDATGEPEGEESPKTLFSLQLFPEMVDVIARFDAVVFVDAHTGAIKEDLQFREIQAAQQANPLTHHMTPEALLALVQIATSKNPTAVLVSVRGFSFQYKQELSTKTTELAEAAVEKIWKWLHQDQCR